MSAAIEDASPQPEEQILEIVWERVDRARLLPDHSTLGYLIQNVLCEDSATVKKTLVPVTHTMAGYRIQNYKCAHDVRSDYCGLCGGRQICEKHGRVKATCKKCRGSQLCKHRKAWSSCETCTVACRCPHGKHKKRCNQCRKPRVAAKNGKK